MTTPRTAQQRLATIEEAEKTIGQVESPKGSNRGPLIDEALRYVGIDPEKTTVDGRRWCAAWACLMLKRGGVQNGPKTASTGGIRAWGTKNGGNVEKPQRGDLGLVKDPTSETGYHHTVLIVGGDGTTYRTIEGNYHDGVFEGKRGASTMDYVSPYVKG